MNYAVKYASARGHLAGPLQSTPADAALKHTSTQMVLEVPSLTPLASLTHPCRNAFDGGGGTLFNGFCVPFAQWSDMVCHLRSDTILSCKCCATLGDAPEQFKSRYV